ncbi:acyl-CoA carboxylase epsilon subunit [Actinokineospora auranticolor]|uniref:Acyl-CoA carboxylase epsilon subunit-like protein n=1 Tax=Actinokineospora auranticolor TaxID=155976 RepID=A0A2S6GX49_9PSEU|nr:acyl-CoA carboxylase epsilon subunit [Actinokineospora auranticolor]PPK69783.1 acyl-CoA carboxylase epsilon subunit-like protein [Actinokineospora auranticolor]
MPDDPAASEPTPEPRPLLRVVKGTPDPAELAALAAVIAAAPAAQPADPTPQPPSAWSDRAAATRRPLPHGPGAWRASAFPR